jgi:hypothetical protein
MENKNVLHNQRTEKTMHLAWIAVISVILIISSFSAAAESLPGRAIRVSMINQEPDPVDAGQYVTVKFRVENAGIETARNVVFEVVQDFPFSLDPGKNAATNLGTLLALQNSENAATLEYTIKVDEKALSGTAGLKLRYNIDNSGWVELSSFPLRVRRYFMGLSIDSVSSAQEYFEPGKENEVTISLKNMADSPMRDVSVSLSLAGTTPFAPIGSGSEKRAYSLSPGETRNFTFKLLSAPETLMGVYKVPLTITYRDESNSNHTVSDVLGIVVNSRPKIDVRLESSAVKSAGSSGKITIKVVNSGTGDVKFLNMKFPDSSEIKIISGSNQYIGQLSSDDYETSDITAYVEKTKAGAVSIPVELSYSDAMGNIYDKTENVELRLYSSAEQRAMGINSGKSPVGIILAIAIVAVGIIVYSRRKKHMQKKQ